MWKEGHSSFTASVGGKGGEGVVGGRGVSVTHCSCLLFRGSAELQPYPGHNSQKQKAYWDSGLQANVAKERVRWAGEHLYFGNCHQWVANLNPGGSWTVYPVANSVLNPKTHAVILEISLSLARKYQLEFPQQERMTGLERSIRKCMAWSSSSTSLLNNYKSTLWSEMERADVFVGTQQHQSL